MNIFYKKTLLLFLKVLFVFLNFLVDSTIYLHRNLWKYDMYHHDIVSSSVPKKDINTESHDGFHHITATHIKKKYRVYRIELEDGKILECADNHLICTPFGYNKQAKMMKEGEHVATKDGESKIKSIKRIRRRSFMFDMTVASEDHLYYSNDILSHNSIVTGIFIVWYLLNHKDRNTLIVSQSGKKVEELMDKIDKILRGLPFYMKLGVQVNNIYSKVFDNGCKLVAETTTDKSGASFTIHLLYADEFALVHHSYIKEFYRTIYPTLSSSDISRMIITSTPRGRNKFYEIYRDAVNSRSRFNPIRVDWYEVPLTRKQLKNRGYSDEEIDEMERTNTVPGRDDKWKADQIADLGTEEDFNQEFGNQFLAGNSLLFKSSVLKRLKNNQIKFKEYEIEVFDHYDVKYDGCLKWHPNFDIMNIENESCQYVISIDLADGNGGDYTVVNIFQILPMSKKEIDNLNVYTEDKDFFKLVQIGIYRTNEVSIPDVAKMFYHLTTDIFIQENLKVIIELNHEGNYFKNLVENMEGDNNRIESEHLWVRFKYNMKDEESYATRQGLRNDTPVKSHGTKVFKDKVKYRQMIIMEHMTVEESLSFAKNKKGSYESQTGNDDCMMTGVNLSHYYETVDFVDQIDEMLPYLPESFQKEIDKKLGKFQFNDELEDDITDLL